MMGNQRAVSEMMKRNASLCTQAPRTECTTFKAAEAKHEDYYPLFSSRRIFRPSVLIAHPGPHADHNLLHSNPSIPLAMTTVTTPALNRTSATNAITLKPTANRSMPLLATPPGKKTCPANHT